MKIIRSIKTVTGDFSVSNGNIVVEGSGNGIIINDQNDAPKIITPFDDDGVDTIKVEDA